MSLIQRVERAQQQLGRGQAAAADARTRRRLRRPSSPVPSAGSARRTRGAPARGPAAPAGRGHERLRPAARPRQSGRAPRPRSRASSTASSPRGLRRHPRRADAPDRRDGPRRHRPRAARAAARRPDHHRGHGQRPDHIYIERRGKIQRIDSVFLNDEHVLRVIDRIITPLGRRIDESSPRVDARLPDGSRVNAIIEPLSLVGPVITVRKFSAKPFTVDDLIRFGTATPEMFDFLRGLRRGPAQPLRLRRHRLGQDDDPQRPLVVHPQRRADRHDRGRRRAPAPPGPRHHARVAPAQPRGRGRDHDPRPAAQRAAHAPRPDHRRRVPRRRGAGHAPGDDHRPGRLAVHRPRQHARRTCSAASRRWS